MNTFEENLLKYAKLAAQVGINIKPHEGLLINANEHGLPLARLVAQEAYKLGAKHVEIQYLDDAITLARYEHGQAFVFDTYPKWKADMLEAMYLDQYHHLFIIAPNPELLKNIPSERVSKDQKVVSSAVSHLMHYRMTSQTKWSIIAAASPSWAKIVFPNLPAEEAIAALWEKIFSATRIDLDDPVSAWIKHDETLKAYKHYLNESRFEKLHFHSPDTDLEVYLAEDHFWMGGAKISQSGDSYVANIPTEEVFTTPHRLKVNGKLTATKPLSLNGKLVEDFGFVFKDGKVVECYAKEGEDILKQLLENDEGAAYLGEVALVSHDSPISNTGILFSNTLFDENASVHFALGRAYPYAMINGTQLSVAELMEKGANDSLIHVDFMVGGPNMTITAYKSNSEAILLFKDGNWVI